MLAPRHSRLPALPSDPAVDQPYAARLDALTARPRRRWPSLLSAGLGLVVGSFATLLWTTGTPAATALTPQQQTLYHLLQDLAQASTFHEESVIITRLSKAVRAAHPQPRPSREVLLPIQAQP